MLLNLIHYVVVVVYSVSLDIYPVSAVFTFSYSNSVFKLSAGLSPGLYILTFPFE